MERIVKIMKLVNYLYNMIRLGVMKSKKRYSGSIFQGIPCSTVLYSSTGTLFLEGRLSSRTNSYLSAGAGSLSIGKNCFINQNAYIVSKESVSIGDNVIIGPNAVIVDHDHDFRNIDFMHNFVSLPVVIEDNVWLGGNVTILKGVTIGHDSVIGAGCVLSQKNTMGGIPPFSLVYLDGDICIKPIEKRQIIENEKRKEQNP